MANEGIRRDFPRSKLDRFTLTEEHVKLLRQMNVEWWDSEYGAPGIDPKRPYGNSFVLGDIHEALTGEDTYGERKWDDATQARYEQLHRETAAALQVVLATGSFEPGEYEAEVYTNRWVRTDA